MEPTKQDPVPSRRAIITESEILHVACPTCKVDVLKPCKSKQGFPLARELDSDELSFHPSRIMVALHAQVTTKMQGVLSHTDRSLIVYYSFIMLADAVAANSMKMFGKQQTSEEIQAFFAQCAITELIKDELIEPPPPVLACKPSLTVN